MNDNAKLLTTFYTAFQQKDYAGMIACYHPEIHFSDPVFTDLHGRQAGAMWHMLCERGQDLQVVFSDVDADGVGAEGSVFGLDAAGAEPCPAGGAGWVEEVCGET